MKKTSKLLLIYLSLGMGLSLSSINANAADEAHAQGKMLHEDKCTSCHTDSVYTREDRMVKTMDALDNQVNNCMKGAAKAQWTQPQTTSVVEYLNNKYYKF